MAKMYSKPYRGRLAPRRSDRPHKVPVSTAARIKFRLTAGLPTNTQACVLDSADSRRFDFSELKWFRNASGG